MSSDFTQPHFKATPEGVVVIGHCGGPEPINGFEPCFTNDGPPPALCSCVCYPS